MHKSKNTIQNYPQDQTHGEEHSNTNTTPTAPQIPNRPQNHPLSLVSRNFRTLAITNIFL